MAPGRSVYYGILRYICRSFRCPDSPACVLRCSHRFFFFRYCLSPLLLSTPKVGLLAALSRPLSSPPRITFSRRLFFFFRLLCLSIVPLRFILSRLGGDCTIWPLVVRRYHHFRCIPRCPMRPVVRAPVFSDAMVFTSLFPASAFPGSLSTAHRLLFGCSSVALPVPLVILARRRLQMCTVFLILSRTRSSAASRFPRFDRVDARERLPCRGWILGWFVVSGRVCFPFWNVSRGIKPGIQSGLARTTYHRCAGLGFSFSLYYFLILVESELTVQFADTTRTYGSRFARELPCW